MLSTLRNNRRDDQIWQEGKPSGTGLQIENEDKCNIHRTPRPLSLAKKELHQWGSKQGANSPDVPVWELMPHPLSLLPMGTPPHPPVPGPGLTSPGPSGLPYSGTLTMPKAHEQQQAANYPRGVKSSIL